MPTRCVLEAASPSSSRPAVLAVDDESTVLELVLEVLHELGCDARSANFGADALAQVKRSADIDLLITDIRMPGMSGFELAEQIRGIRPDLPVLFMTGYTSEFERGVTLGPHTALLIKPFSLAKLSTTISQLLAASSVSNAAPWRD